MSDVQLPIGTRIVFLKSLYGDATGDRPACQYAAKGAGGEVTGHGCREGHWVKWDAWKAPFGAEYGTEFVEAAGGHASDLIGSDQAKVNSDTTA